MLFVYKEKEDGGFEVKAVGISLPELFRATNSVVLKMFIF
jgi:hypothetical protein